MKSQAKRKIINSSAAKSSSAKLLIQIHKTSVYLNDTHEDFLKNASRAKERLNKPEAGVLAGPVKPRKIVA